MTKGRRNGKSSKKVPSASYYIGYVEDDETPEMIMKKFEELERLRQESLKRNNTSENTNNNNETSNNNNNLNKNSEECLLGEDQLKELFKRTSHDNIQTDLLTIIESEESNDDEDYIFNDGEQEEDWDLNNEEEEHLSEEDISEFDNEELLNELADDEDEKKKKKRKKASTSSKKKNILQELDNNEFGFNFHSILMDNNSGQNQQDRKKKSSEIEIVNVPTSKRVLSSWAKQIQAISKENSLKVVEESPLFDFSIDDDEDDITYYCSSSIMSEEDQVPMSLNCKQEEDIVKSTLYKFNYKEDVILVDDMFNFDFKSICNKFGEPLFEGVLIDPPYDTIDIKDLKKLPLNEDWFLTRGYCFIWIEKEYTVQVIKIMKEFEFEYVDSLCWIKERLDQSFSKEENSNLLPKTKLTLFIFRKKNDKTKNMPIKHQRSPDVILDFKRDNPRERSPLIFNMIETLLYNSTRFLEIWGEGVYNNVEYKTNTKWITLKSALKEEK